MRLIDSDELKKKSYRTEFAIPVVDVEDIDNAPTVERPQGEWIPNEKKVFIVLYFLLIQVATVLYVVGL